MSRYVTEEELERIVELLERLTDIVVSQTKILQDLVERDLVRRVVEKVNAGA